MKKARPKNVLAAFAVAPLGGAGLVAAITLVFGLFAGDGGKAGSASAMLFVLASIAGYAVEIIAGIPCYLLLRHVAWVHRLHWIALGAFLGAASAAIWPVRILLLNPDVDHGIAAVAMFTVAGLLWGAASGLAFAWIVKIEPPRADLAKDSALPLPVGRLLESSPELNAVVRVEAKHHSR